MDGDFVLTRGSGEVLLIEVMGSWYVTSLSTLNNISVITRRSVLLVGETGVHGENHRSVTSH
jgi:hypothetical protein